MSALNHYRHDVIMKRLRADWRVSVVEIAGDLNVSEETIRRDLKALESGGYLRRVHGGAVLPTLNKERPLEERSRIQQREKQAVANLALSFVSEGMSVFVDTGTTTLVFANRLKQFQRLNVMTNSLDVALSISRDSENHVRMTPGTLRRNDNALLGYDSIEFVRNHYFDIAFMGIAAVNREFGLMDYEEDEAFMRRALVRQSKLNLILVDDSKFGRTASVRTMGLGDVSHIVTNRRPDEEYREIFEGENVELVHD